LYRQDKKRQPIGHLEGQERKFIPNKWTCEILNKSLESKLSDTEFLQLHTITDKYGEDIEPKIKNKKSTVLPQTLETNYCGPMMIFEKISSTQMIVIRCLDMKIRN
jgi:hypothetical protein